MSKKSLILSLLAPLALLPAAAQAQPPGGYGSYGSYGSYDQQGYYDHTGRWHAGEANPYPDGYYDQSGTWHPYADQASGGYYDRNGNWVPNTAQPRSGGYYDRNGNWVPNGQVQNQNGYYDRNGNWVPYSANGGYYGHAYGSDRYGYGSVTGPERWIYNEHGRAESLDYAARNLAMTAESVAREATRHSRYGDRLAVDALQRLSQQATYFARVNAQRTRGELVGRAYADLVNAFVAAQQRFVALQPDGWLNNRFYVLASAMGRLDRRYFGGRAFGGRNPGDLGPRAYGNSQYYPGSYGYGYGHADRDDDHDGDRD